MKIIAHRGEWLQEEEKNGWTSIERALKNGYGIETDIREYCGELVLSHDIATSDSIKVEKLLSTYQKIESSVILALNVKEDGIQDKIKMLIQKYQINNYFFFDMSVPEMVVYHKKELIFFTRQSDIERQGVLYEKANGVWLDSFYDFRWLKSTTIMNHLSKGKKACVVSPELHGKNETELWMMLKTIKDTENLWLCTDYVEKAREFFNE